MVVADWKPSTQVLAVPLQESVPSHGPPVEVPTQVVVAAAKPSAGQSLLTPSQLSATSHCPAETRQVVVDGEVFDEHTPLALQVSGASHAPLDGSPQAVPTATGMCCGVMLSQV